MSKRSTFISTVMLAIAAIAVIVVSLGSSVHQTDEFASTKQRNILVSLLKQHGTALARELKVQTFWGEGYKNAHEANTPWMSEYYGAFLERVLGYRSIYVLNGSDEAIFGYENSVDVPAAVFDAHRQEIADLIKSIRSPASDATHAVRLLESRYDIGNGQEVVHRAVSDVRLFNNKPSIVVISTILPDSALDRPMTDAAPLMVAVSEIDDAYLKDLGQTFGFSELSWSDGSPEARDALFRLTADNRSEVGTLHWHSDRPGWELAKSIAPGLIIAMALFVALTAYLVNRSNRQSDDIEAQAKKLALANETLEQRVSERTKELEVTFDNMAQGILLLGPDGDVIISNKQSKLLLEVETDEDLAGTIANVMREADGRGGCPERRSSNITSRRRDRVCPSGRIVEVRHAQLANNGSVITISDVTALKRRQSELEAATVAANAASEEKSRFLSTMSHEMRTPLNGLIGALDLIQKSQLDGPQKELVSIALQASEALLVHISDVLDFSKLEAGKFELDSKPFNLHRMARSVAGIVSAQVESQRNKLVLDVADDLPRYVLGDSVRLRQIILNFVTNANKFTRHGTISLVLKRASGDDRNPRISVAVIDTGIGIPKDRLKDLFQEFSMVESGYTRKSAGTGLGLAICKRLVESMDGTIGVDSEVGKGSTFWFEIALSKADDLPEESEAILDMAEKGFAGLKILLVDDNATNRLIGSKLLNSGGHLVSLAKNGREAVDFASETRFDAILMDISMPEMDGLEATRLIRKLAEPFNNVPIVALTANAIIGDREKFLAAGMDDYLTKPFRLADIQLKLAALVQKATEAPILDSVSDAEPSVIVRSPILDAAELSEIAAATSEDVVVIAIETYVSELRLRAVELDAALKKDDTAMIKTVCHAIAGASRSVGARKLGDYAKEAEIACINANIELSRRLAAELEPLIKDTERAFDSYLTELQMVVAANNSAAA